jgi:deazaflavin-dependent oxidoreductase (nitroreductase family)
MPYVRTTRLGRVLNGALGALVKWGVGPGHVYLLEVQGRKSGMLHTTPVDPLPYEGRLYLVAPRGNTQWARNARAAGTVQLRKGHEVQAYHVRALPEAERPPILKAYLDRFHREVQRYFPVPAGSPVEDMAPLASRYPVFELRPATASLAVLPAGSGPG